MRTESKKDHKGIMQLHDKELKIEKILEPCRNFLQRFTLSFALKVGILVPYIIVYKIFLEIHENHLKKHYGNDTAELEIQEEIIKVKQKTWWVGLIFTAFSVLIDLFFLRETRRWANRTDFVWALDANEQILTT